MVSKGILFLILPESSVAKVRTSVTEMIVPGARDSVQILSDAGATFFSTDVKTRTAQDLISQLWTFPAHADNRLIVGHEVRCSISDLEDWWEAHEFGNSNVQKMTSRALIREVKEHLERNGQHWRIHASAEMQKFDGPQSHLDAWLQGFGELNCPNIGRKIAAILQVIPSKELVRRAFATYAQDLVGLRRANCYVQDDDTGGSWVEMQGILTHACPLGTVHAVGWDKAAKQITFPDVSVDEFVIYEDGLWSGREAVRRLHAIAAAPPSTRITFRFGVVTDFGLMVARQAIRALGLTGSVSIDATASEYVRFLKGDVPEGLLLGLDADPKHYFADLHEHVDPFAFRFQEDWTNDEIRICEMLGEQLVRRWLLYKSGEPPSEDEVARFALGGGRFSSTVLFSRSVPKVCLPLLWLDGTVEIGGKQVNWKPLFVDARRVSDGGLLLKVDVQTVANS